MLGTIGFILLITTLYRGVTCFFGKETFLVLDVRWIGDVSVSIFASLLICVWELVKAMCVSVKARLRKRDVELEHVTEPAPEEETSGKPCEASHCVLSKEGKTGIVIEPPTISRSLFSDNEPAPSNKCRTIQPPPSLFDTFLPDNNIPQSGCYQQTSLFDDDESAAKE